MQVFKLVPVIAFTAALMAACAQEDAVDEGTELTPADTALSTPPPAMDEMDDMADTIAMEEGDTLIMMEGDTSAM